MLHHVACVHRNHVVADIMPMFERGSLVQRLIHCQAPKAGTLYILMHAIVFARS